MARRSALTPEVSERIMEALKLGATINDAAMYGGITERTYHRWLARGRNSTRGKFRQFCLDTTRARADGRVDMLSCISKAAPNDWRAAAWRVAHCSDGYTKTARIQAEIEKINAEDTPKSISLDDLALELTDDEVRELDDFLARVAKRIDDETRARDEAVSTKPDTVHDADV